MSAPTSQQKSDLHDVTGEGSTANNGAYLGGSSPIANCPPYVALSTACNLSNWQIGLSDAIDLYAGFMIWNDLVGGTLVPDPSSSDSILAFVGRVREIYAQQNP